MSTKKWPNHKRSNSFREQDRDRPQRMSTSSDYPFKSPPTAAHREKSLSPRQQHHRPQDRARSPTQMVKQLASQYSTLSDHEKLRTLKEQIMRHEVPYYKPNPDALLANVVPPLAKGLSSFERDRRFSNNDDLNVRRPTLYDVEDRRGKAWDDPQDRRRLVNSYGDSRDRDRDIPRDAHARRYSGSRSMDVDPPSLSLSASTSSAGDISGRRPFPTSDIPLSIEKDTNGNLPLHLQRSNRKGSYSQQQYPPSQSGVGMPPPVSPVRSASERGRQSDGESRLTNDHTSRLRPISPRGDQSRDRYLFEQGISHRTSSEYSPTRRRSSLDAQSLNRDAEGDLPRSRDRLPFDSSRRDLGRQDQIRRPSEDTPLHMDHLSNSTAPWSQRQRSPLRTSPIDDGRLPLLPTSSRALDSSREMHRDIGPVISPPARVRSSLPEPPPSRLMSDREDIPRRSGSGDGAGTRRLTPPGSQLYPREHLNRGDRLEDADHGVARLWPDERPPIIDRYIRRPGESYSEGRSPSRSGRGRSVEPRPRSPLSGTLRNNEVYHGSSFDRGQVRWDPGTNVSRATSSSDVQDRLHTPSWHNTPPSIPARFPPHDGERGRSPPRLAGAPVETQRRGREIEAPTGQYRRPDERQSIDLNHSAGLDSRASPARGSLPSERVYDRTLPKGEQLFDEKPGESRLRDAPGTERDWQRGSGGYRTLSPVRSSDRPNLQRSPPSSGKQPPLSREPPDGSDQSQPPRWRNRGDEGPSGPSLPSDTEWRDHTSPHQVIWSRSTRGRPKADDLNDAYPPPPPLPSTHVPESQPLGNTPDSNPAVQKESVDSSPNTSKPPSPAVKSEPIDDTSGRWISNTRVESSRHSSIRSSTPLKRPSDDRMSVDAPPTAATLTSSNGTQQLPPAESPRQSSQEKNHSQNRPPNNVDTTLDSPRDKLGLDMDIVVPHESAATRESSSHPSVSQPKLPSAPNREQPHSASRVSSAQRDQDVRRQSTQQHSEGWSMREERDRRPSSENLRDSDRPLPGRDMIGLPRPRESYPRDDSRYEQYGGSYPPPPSLYPRDLGHLQNRRRSPEPGHIRGYDNRRPLRRLTPSPPPASVHYQNSTSVDEHRSLKRPRDIDSFNEYDRRRTGPPPPTSGTSTQPMWDSRMAERDRREAYDYRGPPPLPPASSRYDDRPYDPRDRGAEPMVRASGRDWGGNDQRGLRDQGTRRWS